MADWSGLVLGLVGGGALGSLGTVIYRSGYERAERVRDRMIEAADAFLTQVEEARTALADLELNVRQLADVVGIAVARLDAADEALSARRQELREGTNRGEEDAKLDKAFVALRLAGAYLGSSMDVIEPEDEPPEKMLELMEELAQAAYEDENLRSLESVLQAIVRVRRLTVSTTANIRRTDQLRRSAGERIPRLMLVFPAGEADMVTEAADEIVNALEELNYVGTKLFKERDPERRKKIGSSEARASLDAATRTFAARVQAELAMVGFWRSRLPRARGSRWRPISS
jgi:hypothetical protein